MPQKWSRLTYNVSIYRDFTQTNCATDRTTSQISSLIRGQVIEFNVAGVSCAVHILIWPKYKPTMAVNDTEGWIPSLSK